MQNTRFFKANTLSPILSGNQSKDKVRRLRILALIITGENTIKTPEARQPSGFLTIHHLLFYPGSPRENPQEFNEAVLMFFAITARESGDME